MMREKKLDPYKRVKAGSYDCGYPRYIDRQPTRMHSMWKNMWVRCTNPAMAQWHRYGGRGISVCAEWRDYNVFADFCVKKGYGDGLTIDRIDNDGNYEPGNVRFVTLEENIRNRTATDAQREASRESLGAYWADVKAGRRERKGKDKAVVCVETGEVYKSGAAAGRAIGRGRKAVCASIKTGTRAGGYHWKHACEAL